LVLLSGVAGWVWFSDRPTIEPAALTLTDPLPSAPARAAPSTPSEPAVRVAETAIPATVTTEPAGIDPAPLATTAPASPDTLAVGTTSPAASETPAAAPVPDAVPAAAGSASNMTMPGAAALPERPRPLPALPDPAPALIESPATPPIAIAGADGIALSDTAVTLTAPSPAAASNAAPVAPLPAPSSPVPDERQVRAILSRYEAAYNSLDAAAAGAVWPGVDQRALASAFQGLSAQTVSLGRCDVRVSGTTAQAECSGTARWNPKVGGGPQSASRQWRFNLRSTGRDWVITQATVR
jgi:hypothetical protein